MDIEINWFPSEKIIGTVSSGYRVSLKKESQHDRQHQEFDAMELMLMSIGSSSTVSLMHILRTSKVYISQCLTKVSANSRSLDLFELNAVQIHFNLVGQRLSETVVDRALILSQEQCCSVTKLLRRAEIDITYTFALHGTSSDLPSNNQSMTASLQTRGLHHIALTSSKFEASRRFYTEIMKMQVEWEPDSDNVYLTNGNDNLALHRGYPQDEKLDHIGFILNSIEQVDQWYSYLRECNVHIDKEPKTHRDGARSFYVTDPDGVLVQLIYHPPLSKQASNE